MADIDILWWWYTGQHQESQTQHLLKMNLGYKLVHCSLKKFSNLINNPLGSSYSGYFINQLSHSSQEISKKNLIFPNLQSSHPLHYRVWSDCTQWYNGIFCRVLSNNLSTRIQNLNAILTQLSAKFVNKLEIISIIDKVSV